MAAKLWLQVEVVGCPRCAATAGRRLWFGPELPAPVAELAARYGDRSGQGAHLGADSVRYLWLDRAQRA